jgi:hypothetical protein
MRFVPLPEWRSINHYDGIFYKRLCSHQFIIRGIVYYVNDTGFASTACTKLSITHENKENIFNIQLTLAAGRLRYDTSFINNYQGR